MNYKKITMSVGYSTGSDVYKRNLILAKIIRKFVPAQI